MADKVLIVDDDQTVLEMPGKIVIGKENMLIRLFIDNVNRVFSKDMIYDLVWGEAIVDDNAVMVYINRLRQKIEDDPSEPKYIQNIRGMGYRFVIQD